MPNFHCAAQTLTNPIKNRKDALTMQNSIVASMYRAARSRTQRTKLVVSIVYMRRKIAHDALVA